MGFGKLLKGVGKAVSAVSKVGNVPIVGNVLKAVPGVGTALSLAGAATAGYQLLSGGGGGGGGGLPAIPGNAYPALPGGGVAPPIVGSRSILRDDPNVVDALKPWAIATRNLRTAYRSPVKGYVVLRDSAGDPYAIPKFLATKYLGYKSAKKPPISVGDWEAVKRADRTVKKVRKIMTTMTRVDAAIGSGKVKVKSKKRKG